MTLLRKIAAELFGMFVADLRLTVMLLATVAAASFTHVVGAAGWLVGLILIGGTVIAIGAAVHSEAARRRR